MPFSDDELAVRFSTALEAAGDVAYSWDLDGDRLDWSGQDSNGVNAAKWFTASRVLSYTAMLGALNIVLITAMSTIGAVVYNLTSRLIGGVEITLRETE